jgi:hypothetical protein
VKEGFSIASIEPSYKNPSASRWNQKEKRKEERKGVGLDSHIFSLTHEKHERIYCQEGFLAKDFETEQDRSTHWICAVYYCSKHCMEVEES